MKQVTLDSVRDAVRAILGSVVYCKRVNCPLHSGLELPMPAPMFAEDVAGSVADRTWSQPGKIVDHNTYVGF